jgi:predicted methyltransferase
MTNASLEALPFGTIRFPKPLDMVWITQSYHDLKIAEYGQVDIAAFSRAVFASLKPGGTYLIPTVPGHAAADEQQIAGLNSFDINAEMRRACGSCIPNSRRLASALTICRNARRHQHAPILQ